MNRDGIETHFDPNLDTNDENRADDSHNVGVENDCVERVTDFLMNDTLDETWLKSVKNRKNEQFWITMLQVQYYSTYREL